MRITRLVSAAFCVFVAACGGSSSGSGGGDGGDAAVCTHTMCGTECADLSSDTGNCGFCGNACGSYQTCAAGKCTAKSQSCPAAFSGAPPQAVAAYDTENKARANMGVPCADLVAAADTSASKHCAYYLANFSNPACVMDPHVEVMGCPDYVAQQFFQRMQAAGYSGSPAFEDMDFVNNGATAAQNFIDSIWHRTPILSPWVRDMGYGGGTGNGMGCDTIDFGVGASTPLDVTAVYPYPGQEDVPTFFNGAEEFPNPPKPPSGWPSGYPITVYMAGAPGAPGSFCPPNNIGTTLSCTIDVAVHTITELGKTAPVEHQMIRPQDSDSMHLLWDEVFLYPDKPLNPKTHYHVHVEATGAVGKKTFDWVFTTQE